MKLFDQKIVPVAFIFAAIRPFATNRPISAYRTFYRRPCVLRLAAKPDPYPETVQRIQQIEAVLDDHDDGIARVRGGHRLL